MKKQNANHLLLAFLRIHIRIKDLLDQTAKEHQKVGSTEWSSRLEKLSTLVENKHSFTSVFTSISGSQH